jgi:hypothetical protein
MIVVQKFVFRRFDHLPGSFFQFFASQSYYRFMIFFGAKVRIFNCLWASPIYTVVYVARFRRQISLLINVKIRVIAPTLIFFMGPYIYIYIYIYAALQWS